jgi:enamine deaminase RidA (YjgF/YER057c/UK114 family)
LVLVLAACLAVPASGQKRKEKKEEQTQVLQLPRELPAAVTADTRRLAFNVTPLSARGLLSAQVRNALKALARQAPGQVVAIRAFVAGSGDARRVRELVSEVFTSRKQPLPVLSLVHAGGLPLEGAQVVLESVSVAHNQINPDGLAFFSAYPAVSANPPDPVAPLAAQSLAALARAVKSAGLAPPDVLRVTCLLSSLEGLAATRKLVEAEYPGAAADYVQTARVPVEARAACEAVGRLRADPETPLHLVDFEGLPPVPGQSHAALVGARQVVITGTQASFGYTEPDARLAFERLAKVIEQAGAASRDVAFARYYSLAPVIAAQIRKLGPQFLGGSPPPAGTVAVFEGLPALDAGFAVDVVAVKR